MTRKVFLVLVLACWCAVSVFSLSSGKGKGRTKEADNAEQEEVNSSMSLEGRFSYYGDWFYEGSDYTHHAPTISAFFDSPYAEVTAEGEFAIGTSIDEDFTFTSTYLGFSLLGKYPFTTGNLTFYPLLGVDCRMFLSEVIKFEGEEYIIKRSDLDDVEASDDSSLFLGVGAAYPLNNRLNLRGRFLADIWMDDANDPKLSCSLKGGLDYRLNSRLLVRGNILMYFRRYAGSDTEATCELRGGVDYNLNSRLYACADMRIFHLFLYDVESAAAFRPYISLGVGYRL